MSKMVYSVFVFTFFVINLFSSVDIYAQTPERISYQAVIRNGNGQLVNNQGIGMQVSILQESAEGDAVYVEIHSPVTNINGLVSIEIGGGNILFGNFPVIEWANGPYFVKTEIDPVTEGGSSYTITLVSQLLSVPFAFHAKTAETILGGVTETDPLFSAWDKATGIIITESQISDMGTYLETETDPAFTSWDKSTGISITKDQISDLGTYLETETDPVFGAWNKSTGIIITENQISDLGAYITSETDPIFAQSAAFGITNAGSGAVITSAERTKLNGIEPNAQRNVNADWNATSGDAEILNKPTSVSSFTNDAGYIALAEAPVEGDLLFYSGEGWSKLAKGNPGQVLSISSEGELVWGKLAAIPDASTSEPVVILGGNATLKGVVTPNGMQTTVSFEYGLTSSYGSSVLADQSPLTGNASQGLTASISGLTVGEYYHFRVKAESILGTTYSDDFKFLVLVVGDEYRGGKFLYLFQPADNGYVEGELHGLVAGSNDISTSISWSNETNVFTEAKGTGLGDGAKNTDIIIEAQGAGDYAASICRNYNGGGYTDWYLPSSGELQKLYLNRGLIGGFEIWSSYWSSTEIDTNKAHVLRFIDGSWWSLSKGNTNRVRAVRMF